MLFKQYPEPCRVDYVPSPYEPDEEGVLDIGYYTGNLSDGRKYRLECWQMDDMVMVTVMFSDLGITAYSKQDMYYLLELEDILEFSTDVKKLQCTRTKDDAKNSVWAVNMMLKNAENTFGRLLITLKRYK